MTVYINGNRSNDLTDGVDTAVVTGTKQDTIYGNFTGNPSDSRNTFNPNDTIVGNGKTVLDLSLASWNADMAMPGVSVSGVRTLHLTNLTAQTGVGIPNTVAFDATNWGDSLENIRLSGSGGAELAVTNLTVARKLNVVVSGSGNDVDVQAATYGSYTLTADVDNSTADTQVAKAIVNATSIRAVGGAGDVVSVTANQSTGDVSLDLIRAKSSASGLLGSASANLVRNSEAGAIGALSIAQVEVQGDDADVVITEGSSLALGDASVGAVNLTNVSLEGTTAADLQLAVTLNAASKAANATVGAVTVGSINAALLGGAAANVVDFNIDASTVSGLVDTNTKSVATVGAVDIGNINAAAITGSFKASIDIKADGLGGVTGKGNALESLTVGDVSIGAVGGDAEFNAKATVVHGRIGSVSVGDVDLDVAGAGNEAKLVIGLDAADSVGNVTIQDVVVQAAIGSDLLAGTVGDFQIGVIGNSVGNVSVGHLELDSAGAVAHSIGGYLGMKVESRVGDIGTVNVGTIDIDGGIGAFGVAAGDVILRAAAGGNLGAVSVGTTEIDALAGSKINIDADFTAAGGNTGAVTFGGLDLEANGKAAFATVDINVAAGGTTGALSTGNLVLAAHSAGTIAAGTAGTATVGVGLHSDGGNINVGTITLTSDVTTLGNDASADVTIGTSTAGNIVIGNVSVSGDGTHDNYDVLSSSGILTWLDVGIATATTGTITIGNIDYSSYSGAATIDVRNWLGASEIKGSTGGASITGNVGQNTIELSVAPLVADTVYYNQNQTNGLTLATADLVKNFQGGLLGTDVIDVKATAGSSSGTDVALVAAADYAAFLAAADAGNKSVYASQITGGTDWYVAVDSNNDGTLDYVFKVQSDSALVAGDFNVHV